MAASAQAQKQFSKNIQFRQIAFRKSIVQGPQYPQSRDLQYLQSRDLQYPQSRDRQPPLSRGHQCLNPALKTKLSFSSSSSVYFFFLYIKKKTEYFCQCIIFLFPYFCTELGCFSFLHNESPISSKACHYCVVGQRWCGKEYNGSSDCPWAACCRQEGELALSVLLCIVLFLVFAS